MRERIMQGLRKAGNTFLDIDERYANAIYDRTGGDEALENPFTAVGMMGRAVPIKDTEGFIKANIHESLGGLGPRTLQEHNIGVRNDRLMLGANISSRYLLPAGGVTLAGKGLYDLAVGFGGEADQQEPGQLPLY